MHGRVEQEDEFCSWLEPHWLLSEKSLSVSLLDDTDDELDDDVDEIPNLIDQTVQAPTTMFSTRNSFFSRYIRLHFSGLCSCSISTRKASDESIIISWFDLLWYPSFVSCWSSSPSSLFIINLLASPLAAAPGFRFLGGWALREKNLRGLSPQSLIFQAPDFKKFRVFDWIWGGLDR